MKVTPPSARPRRPCFQNCASSCTAECTAVAPLGLGLFCYRPQGLEELSCIQVLDWSSGS